MAYLWLFIGSKGRLQINMLQDMIKVNKVYQVASFITSKGAAQPMSSIPENRIAMDVGRSQRFVEMYQNEKQVREKQKIS